MWIIHITKEWGGGRLPSSRLNVAMEIYQSTHIRWRTQKRPPPPCDAFQPSAFCSCPFCWVHAGERCVQLRTYTTLPRLHPRWREKQKNGGSRRRRWVDESKNSVFSWTTVGLESARSFRQWPLYQPWISLAVRVELTCVWTAVIKTLPIFNDSIRIVVEFLLLSLEKLGFKKENARRCAQHDGPGFGTLHTERA